jgi:hypothetical protein
MEKGSTVSTYTLLPPPPLLPVAAEGQATASAASSDSWRSSAARLWTWPAWRAAEEVWSARRLGAAGWGPLAAAVLLLVVARDGSRLAKQPLPLPLLLLCRGRPKLLRLVVAVVPVQALLLAGGC